MVCHRLALARHVVMRGRTFPCRSCNEGRAREDLQSAQYRRHGYSMNELDDLVRVCALCLLQTETWSH